MPVLWAVSRPFVQCHPPAWQPGIPAAGPVNDHHAKLAARLRYAPPAIQLGRETVNALTFKLDQSTGAGQSSSFPNLRMDQSDGGGSPAGERHLFPEPAMPLIGFVALMPDHVLVQGLDLCRYGLGDEIEIAGQMFGYSMRVDADQVTVL